jgi:hypothetical protein
MCGSSSSFSIDRLSFIKFIEYVKQQPVHMLETAQEMAFDEEVEGIFKLTVKSLKF